MFGMMMQPQPVVVKRIPGRIQAAMDFAALFRQTRVVGEGVGEQVIANSADEEAAYKAAMQALRLYFNGEIDPDNSGYGPIEPDDGTGQGAKQPPPSPNTSGGEVSPERKAEECQCLACQVNRMMGTQPSSTPAPVDPQRVS